MKNIKSEKGNGTIQRMKTYLFIYYSTTLRITTSQDFKTQKGTIIILFY